MFFGTGSGKLFYYYYGNLYLGVEKQIIFDDNKEGPITSVVCH
jgi:hypothetical protein